MEAKVFNVFKLCERALNSSFHLQEFGVELCKAAATGDMGYVTTMVKHGVDPNAADYAGSTPLHFLAAEGETDAVEFLVQHGADILATDRSVHAPTF